MDFPREEQELIDNIARGDIDAFEQLFNEHWEFLHNVAYNRLQSVDIADDLVQEAFTDIWQKRQSLHIHTSLQAYLYQVIKHKIFNHIRHKAIRQKEEYKALIKEKYYPDHMRTTTGEAVVVKELRQLINQEMEQLSEKSRQIFQLSRYEHYTYKEIADQMGCSAKTVEYHISKVLGKLKLQVEKYRAGLLSLAISLFSNFLA